MSVPHTSTHTMKYEDLKDLRDPVTFDPVGEIRRPCQKIKNRNGSTNPKDWTYYDPIYDMDQLRAWVTGPGNGQDYNKVRMNWNEWDNGEWDNKTEGEPIDDPNETYDILKRYQQEPIVQRPLHAAAGGAQDVPRPGSIINDDDFIRQGRNFIPQDIDDLMQAVEAELHVGLQLQQFLPNANDRNLRLLEVIIHAYRNRIRVGYARGFSGTEHATLYTALRQVRSAWLNQRRLLDTRREYARILGLRLSQDQMQRHMEEWARTRAAKERRVVQAEVPAPNIRPRIQGGVDERIQAVQRANQAARHYVIQDEIRRMYTEGVPDEEIHAYINQAEEVVVRDMARRRREMDDSRERDEREARRRGEDGPGSS